MDKIFFYEIKNYSKNIIIPYKKNIMCSTIKMSHDKCRNVDNNFEHFFIITKFELQINSVCKYLNIFKTKCM